MFFYVLQLAALLVASGVHGLLYPRARHSQIPLDFISHQETFFPNLKSA